VIDAYYRDYPVMVIGWGWAVDTGTHVLRMICAGVFDRYPRLKIIIGHMGELLPYCLTRLELMTLGDWLLDAQEARGSAPRLRMEKSVHHYMRQNVFVTSSGVFDQPVLGCAVAMLDIDNLLFSVDYPLRDNFEAMEFLRAARLSEANKEKFAHGNAERLLKLAPARARQADVAQPRMERLADSLFAFQARTRSKVGRALVSRCTNVNCADAERPVGSLFQSRPRAACQEGAPVRLRRSSQLSAISIQQQRGDG
jgi:Amidohydrolase